MCVHKVTVATVYFTNYHQVFQCTDTMSESSGNEPLLGNPGAANLAVGVMASHIFDRLISHSRFVPVMLNMKDSQLPLPAAAQKLKLRSPFGSILPLVESRPFSQVCSFDQNKEETPFSFPFSSAYHKVVCLKHFCMVC